MSPGHTGPGNHTWDSVAGILLQNVIIVLNRYPLVTQGGSMKKCLLPAYAIAILTAIICISVIPVNAQADVITVCKTGCNFSSVQDAINSAVDGDTIQVMSGSYNEVIDINRSVNLVGINSSGEYPHIGQYTMPVAVTISTPGVVFEGFDIHGEGEHAIEIKASHVMITNITIVIHRPTAESDAIIEGAGLSDITISDSMMQSSGYNGIFFSNSQELTIERNFIMVNNESTYERPRAIAAIFSSSGAEYTGFRFENNTVTGGGIESSVTWPENETSTPYIRDVIIRNNIISGCSSTGIVVGAIPEYTETEELIYHLSDVAVQDNNISDLTEGSGIMVFEAGNGVISGNVVKNLHEYGSGIDLEASTRFRVTDNTISDCKGEDMTGLAIYGVTSSVVSGNRMDRNTYNFQYENGRNLTPMMDIDATNLADGRPIRYYEGMSHFSVDGDEADGAGYYFVSCRDFIASQLAPSDTFDGILLVNCQNGSLAHSSAERCGVGVSLLSSSDILVYTNRLVDNRYGIRISGFNNSIIWRNDVINSTEYGMMVNGLNHDLKINNNNVRNSFIGMYLVINPNYDTNGGISLDGNEIMDNQRGLTLRGTRGLTVTNNVIGNTSGIGISLQYTRDALFSQNKIQYNTIGIGIMSQSSAPYVTGNNTFVNNYFNNVNQVAIVRPVETKGELFMDQRKGSLLTDEIKEPVLLIETDPSGETNYWNSTKTSGTNIIGGPNLGGNYWASPDGTGFSETHPDRGDGFCNEPYVFNEWNTDYLPLHTYTPKPSFFADFVVSPVNGTAPLTVQCTDKSLGSPTRYYYNFGDGASATGKNPVHTYRYPGTYTITHTITKYNSATNSMMNSSMIQRNIINVNAGPEVLLVADFIVSPTNGMVPLTVQCTDKSVGNPTRIIYNFGDDASVTGPNPSHTYRFPGTYTITQTITKYNATSGQMMNSSMVKRNVINVTAVPPVPLVAKFTASPVNGTAPLKVTFHDESAGNPAMINFDFGDGMNVTGANPVHTYRVPGVYNVTETIFRADPATGGTLSNSSVKLDFVTVF
jgi:PKD repeat protein/nitrous oxidase accessory protein NosD